MSASKGHVRRRSATLILFALGSAASSWSLAQSPVAHNSQTGTRVVLLGTGTPNADPDRSGPSVAVVVDGVPYLVDCGPGVVRRAAAAFRKGITGLKVINLNRLFITHLHSDHTVGLPDIMLSPWTLERTDPLEVYGPRGVKAMTSHLLRAYSEDIRIRLYGGEPSNKTGYRVVAREIRAGVVYRDANVTVSAFPVKHGSWREAYGYRFETKDKTVVISGDTSPSDSVVRSCNGCDILIHEVYSDSGFARRARDWQNYHSRYHTSASRLGELAERAKPKLLVLYHQLFWGTSEEDLLKEVRSKYSGNVVSGHDLEIY